MNLLADIDNGLVDAVNKLRTLDADAFGKVAQLKSTTDGAEAFELIAQLYDATVPPEVRLVASGVIKSLAALVPAAQPAAENAIPENVPGPQVSGQA